ncbi:MAG: ABC transporter permease [Ancrocorticia sp.]|jgi:ABC-2 type transport system permease protein|nr:ABC transporter permease [Ancrocorticia sp.]MCI1896665.1 ABC transporter permease [Ancrocorticia sp.]MCI1963867.1 ABC transporter permease [Ancrocorticia sp.]MCI2002205.1 ABC transporter permease [Ancrocorticia sp.]MCI2029487.1 ABC transporter permease [Ancrocorticia sp.]
MSMPPTSAMPADSTVPTSNAPGGIPPEPRPRVLSPLRYHAGFGNSLRSELRKLTTLRSFWVISGTMIALYSLYIWALSSAQNSLGVSSQGLDGAIITSGISVIIVFGIMQGTVATTNEYSSNTMRTTALSDPNRPRAYFAKIVAAAITSGVANAIMTLLAVVIRALVAGGTWSPAYGNARAVVLFWLVLTTGTVMAAELGYALRSTAGTITTAILALYISQMIVIIPNDWVRGTLVNYLPLSALQAAVQIDPVSSFLSSAISWNVGLLTWLIYVVTVGLLGLLRYTRSDI